MTIAEIEELIRKYLATGIAVLVVLVAPGTTIDRSALPSGSQVVTVEPTRPGPTPSGRPTPAPDRNGDTGTGSGSGSDSGSGSGSDSGSGSGDRTGAGGSDPGADDRPGAGSDPGSEPGNDPGNGSGNGSDSGSDAGSNSNEGSNSDEGSGSDGSDAAPGADTGSGSDSGANSGSGPDERTGGTGSSSSTSEGTTAAATLGWGTPNREDDFSSGAGQWSIYDGAGHGGQGKRSPSAVSTTGGVLTLTGDSSGTTAGMAWNPGQKYGRWEGRVKAPASDPSYNALLLLWPDAEDWPSGGEVDFMEMSDPSRQETNMFLHYGADNQQLNGKVQIDATQWHNWAVEWTPDAITAYVDGKEWYRTTDKNTFPPGPMHLCIQLDWFPQGGGAKESTMQVDWVRQYPVGGGSSASSGTGGNGSGTGGSGQQTGQEPAGNTAGGTDGSSDGGDQFSGVRNFLRRMFSWG